MNNALLETGHLSTERVSYKPNISHQYYWKDKSISNYHDNISDNTQMLSFTALFTQAPQHYHQGLNDFFRP